jgi:hypothetical protein
MADVNDLIHWNVKSQLLKWDRSEDHDAGLAPDGIEDFEGNLLLNAGITRLLNLLVAAGATQAYDATHCRIGVGDSSTAAAATQTDLQAATNKLYHLVDSAPSVAAQTVTFVATFGSSEANFAWAEWGIDVGTATNTTGVAPMLNRKVQSMGTKASGATWVFTVTITIA